MSLRAEGMQYRSTDKEKTKETGALSKSNLSVALLLKCFAGVGMVGIELFVSGAAHHPSKNRCISAVA